MNRTNFPGYKRDKVTRPVIGEEKVNEPYNHFNYDYYSNIRAKMIEVFEEYFKSYEWHILRCQVIYEQKNRCKDCGILLTKGDGGTVHHCYYDYFGQGNYEEKISCVYVCRRCHRKRHAQPDMIVPFWASRNHSAYFPSNKYKQELGNIYMNL